MGFTYLIDVWFDIIHQGEDNATLCWRWPPRRPGDPPVGVGRERPKCDLTLACCPREVLHREQLQAPFCSTVDEIGEAWSPKGRAEGKARRF